MAWAAGNRYFRQKITISGANVAGDVTGFPVAINIPAGNDIFSEADTGGTDVLFTASNGFTLLDFERSVWDKSGEEGIFYVKTDLLSASDNEIYIYYGGFDLIDYEDAANTWDSNFSAIWHFEDGTYNGSANEVQDSSGNGNHGRASGGVQGADDTWGQALNVLDSNDYARFESNLDIFTEHTISCLFWIPLSNSTSWHTLTRGGSYHQIILDSGHQLGNYQGGFHGTGFDMDTLSTGLHHIVVVRKTNGTGDFYVDGSYVGNASTQPQDDIYAVGNYQGGGQHFGKIDEFRVSNSTGRSANWIAVEAENLLNNLTFISSFAARELNPNLITTSPHDHPTVVEVGEFQPFGGYRQITTAYTGGTASTVYYDMPVDIALADTVSGTSDLDIDLTLAASGTFTPSFFNIDTDFEISSSGFFLDGLIKYRNDFNIGFLVPGEYLASDVDVAFFQGFLDVEHKDDVDVDFFLGFITDVGEGLDVDFDVANTNLVPGNLTENYLVEVYSSTYSGTGYQVPPEPTYSDWFYRRKIIVDGSKVAANHTDFPMAIKIDGSNSLFSNTRADGYDIFFTESDGITKLSHELAIFNQGSEIMVAYVKCGLSTGGSQFYMYYGNPTASDQSDSVNTWDSNYVGVWHLTEVPNSTSQDSTSNNNDLTHYNMASGDRVGGPIGYAYDFDGSNDRLQKSSFSNWPTTAITAEVLMKTTDSSKEAATISYAISSTYNNEFLLFDHSKAIAPHVHNFRWDNDTPFNDGSWHHSAATWQSSGGTIRILKDGSQAAGTSSLYSGGSLGGGGTLVIAQEQDSVGGGFDSNQAYLGQLAEIRISNIVRSDDWIETTYNNLLNNSDFFYFGEEEIGTRWELEDYINVDTTVSGGRLWPFPTDVFSSVSGTQFNFISDLYVSLCNTVPSGQVYKSPEVWPVGSGFYMASETTVSGGRLTGYDQDVYVSLETMTTTSGGGIDSDIRLHAMEILNFFLDVDEYTTSASTMYVDIVDKRRIPISTANSYFTVSGTQVPVTFSGIEIPMTDLGAPIVASGYRMFYDPAPDFISDEPIEIVAHAENIVDDKLEETYYLLYGYNLVFDTPPSVEWPWGDDVVVWAMATNKATCPTTSADGWIFSTVPRQHADLGATINPIGGEGLLPAVIYPQLRPNTFFYGANVKVVIKAKDLAGNEMEPFTLDFTIEDKPN